MELDYIRCQNFFRMVWWVAWRFHPIEQTFTQKISWFVEAPTLGAGQWWKNPIKSVEKMVDKLCPPPLRPLVEKHHQWLEDENAFLDGLFSGANC